VVKDHSTRAKQHRTAQKFQAAITKAQAVFGDDFDQLMVTVAKHSQRNERGFFTYPGMFTATAMLEAACQERQGKE